MQEHIWVQPSQKNDLRLYQYGYEECVENHSYGPAKRDHYLLHFIMQGQGVFHIENKSYSLKSGHAFLICPNTITSYHADSAQPWTYYWVGFHGQNAEYYLHQAGISAANPLFIMKNPELIPPHFQELKTCNPATVTGQMRMTACLYRLFADLIDHSALLGIQGKAVYNSKEEYVKNAVLYMQSNYQMPLSVSEVADMIGLNRSYFGAIFKESMGMSPRDYLISLRVDLAKKLLADRLMTVGDVARSVGYEDSLTFSKIFKKNAGVSPNAYRKEKNI